MAINTADAKHGMRVRRAMRDDYTEYLLLDRAPGGPRTWWLQDAETGAIGESDDLDYLNLVADDYRETDLVAVGTRGLRPARERAGQWALVRSTERGSLSSWEIVHAPSGLRATSPGGTGLYRTVTAGRAALARFASIDINASGLGLESHEVAEIKAALVG